MELRTRFPMFPGARVDELIPRLVQVLTFVRDFSPTRRSFREWCSEMGWWSKEAYPAIWDTFGVAPDGEGKLQLGPWATELLEADTRELQREAVFKYLVRENELLAKFVFSDIKEQVKGTEQVYRGLTSYQYKGETPPLDSLRRLIAWFVATGFLKKIGVAWTLTEKAKAIYGWIDAIDEEEILEALAAQQPEEQEEKDGEEARAPAATQGAPARPPTTAAQLAPPDRDAYDEEDPPDTAPEPPRALVPAAAYAAQSVPASVPRIRAPVRFRAVQHPPLEVDATSLAETLGRLSELARKYREAAPGAVHATDVGLTAGEYKGRKKPYFVFRVACLGALQCRAPIASGLAANAYRCLEEDGVFKELFVDNYVLEDVLATQGYYVDDELRRAASRVLVDLLPIRTALRDGGSNAIRPLETAANGDELLERLRQLSAETLDLELFFIAREMARSGFWGEAAEDIALVPDRATRDQGFRLGFLDSPYAHELQDLREHVRRLQAWFGRGEQYGLPLRTLESAYGCRYRCPRIDVCEYICREKHQVG